MFESIFTKASDIMINLISAAIILLIGAILGKALGKTLTVFLREIELNRFTQEDLKLPLNLEDYTGVVTSYICYVISVHLALNTLNLTTPAFYAVFFGAIILIGLSLAISIRDFFPNFSAGMRLRKERKMHDSKQMQYENMIITVIHIGLLETRIKNQRSDELLVPNTEMEKAFHKKPNRKNKKR